VLAPDGRVAAVSAAINGDGVAVAGQGRHGRRHFVLARRADLPGGRAGLEDGRQKERAAASAEGQQPAAVQCGHGLSTHRFRARQAPLKIHNRFMGKGADLPYTIVEKLLF